MRTSSVAQAAFLLALTAGTGSATRHRITIKDFGVKFRIDWWDDNRDQPYRISFTKRGLDSNYRCGNDGALNTITVAGEIFDFSSTIKASAEASDGTSDAGSRKLLTVPEDIEEDEIVSDHYHRRLIFYCFYCEDTRDMMCDVGLPAVCAVVDELTGDPKTAAALMCNKFEKECNAASAEEICEDICIYTHSW